MAWLAQSPGVLVPTGDLAKSTRVPAHYLAKVLQQLAAANLITGRRGVGGGYRLAREAREITLRDVVLAVSPIGRIEACPLGLEGHGGALCPMHRAMDAIASTVLNELSRRTLADLLNQPGHETPLCVDKNGRNGCAPAMLSINGSGNGVVNGVRHDAGESAGAAR